MWFIIYRIVISMVFYGLALNSGNLGGNFYLNFLIQTLVEYPAYTICLVLMNRMGRKPLHCLMMIIGGICCICTIFTMLYADKCKNMQGVSCYNYWLHYFSLFYPEKTLRCYQHVIVNDLINKFDALNHDLFLFSILISRVTDVASYTEGAYHPITAGFTFFLFWNCNLSMECRYICGWVTA